jgi:hypothetical protein
MQAQFTIACVRSYLLLLPNEHFYAGYTLASTHLNLRRNPKGGVISE